jgi:hypothetical protein
VRGSTLVPRVKTSRQGIEQVVVGFAFCGRDVAYFTVQAVVVVPVDPLGGGQLHIGQSSPGPAGLDQLGLEQADRRLHQRVKESILHRTRNGSPLLNVVGAGPPPHGPGRRSRGRFFGFQPLGGQVPEHNVRNVGVCRTIG